MTRLGSMVSAAAMVGLVAGAAVQAQTTCVGDCSGKDVVRVNDLILGVNISLNIASLTMCPSFDCNHTGTVTVNCLIQGVNNALIGCPGAPTSTPKATPNVTATPTNTSQPTPTATTGTTERVFNITTMPLQPAGVSGQPYGICSGTPANTHCQDTSDCPNGQTCSRHAIGGLFSSANGGGNAALLFTQGPLVLELGSPGANGVASLSLKQDVSVKATTIIATCACLKFLAATSVGQMYCGTQMGGGPPFDTLVNQTGTGSGWTVTTGLGPASNPGDGNLLVSTRFQYIDNTTTTKCSCVGVSGTCSTVDCSDDSVYMDPPNQFPFTTTTANAMKTLTPPPNAMTSAPGQPFDCANFATPGTGVLAVGLAADIVLPSADVLRISENAP